MNPHQPFIDAINAEQGQGDRLAEYVYADWLEEQDPRAEAWRVLLEAGKKPKLNASGGIFDGWNWWNTESDYREDEEDRFPFHSHIFDDFGGNSYPYWWTKPFTTYFKAMNAAAVAWVRYHRDPDYEPLELAFG